MYAEINTKECLLCQVDNVYIIENHPEKFWYLHHLFNTLRPRQNGRHFADDTFRRIFLNENVWTLLKNSLIVPKVWINNIPAFVQIKWLGANQATSHYLNQWWLVYWHIYASLGLNELKVYPLIMVIIHMIAALFQLLDSPQWGPLTVGVI